jgi:VIT1/CCC1 family predicted Fe2+/Mn2+ transporter
MKLNKINQDYFRNAIFGAEDSLVSTVGILFGVSTAIHDKATIIITGIVLIAVAGLSMGAGAFLSETSTQQLNKKKKHTAVPWLDGLVMIISYFLAGLIPLVPYFLFEVSVGKYVSIVGALISLFLLGLIPTKKFKDGLRMVSVAGIAILVGFLVGNFFS